MSAAVAPPMSKPVNDALVIRVALVRTKSSAVSVSPELEGREVEASLPSTFPVLNANGSAHAGVLHKAIAANASDVERTRLMDLSSRLETEQSSGPAGWYGSTRWHNPSHQNDRGD